jgi:hypothetical protein
MPADRTSAQLPRGPWCRAPGHGLGPVSLRSRRRSSRGSSIRASLVRFVLPFLCLALNQAAGSAARERLRSQPVEHRCDFGASVRVIWCLSGRRCFQLCDRRSSCAMTNAPSNPGCGRAAGITCRDVRALCHIHHAAFTLVPGRPTSRRKAPCAPAGTQRNPSPAPQRGR